MQKEIKNYDFVDCLLVNFSVDKLISTLSIVTEAYYPSPVNTKRKKGLLKVTFEKILKAEIDKNEEFEFDILLPYDSLGNDAKANEIYSIDISHLNDEKYSAQVNSDMLKLQIEFKKLTIEEIENQ